MKLMRKAKEKKEALREALTDKFVIYQIERPLINSGKRKFKPSKVASPFFGSNVVDKQAFTDNSGSLDVDYGYDYVRKTDEKHISEEELIKRHGTKYYEFGINDATNLDSDKEALAPKEESTAFITSLDDFIEDIPTPADGDSSEDTLEFKPIDIMDEDKEFDIKIDEKPELKFNDFSNDLPHPQEKSMPDFLLNKENEDVELKFNDDLDIPADTTRHINIDEPKIMENNNTSSYYNPAVDPNISIDEAIRRSKESFYEPIKPEPKKESIPYEIPYKEFFPVSVKNEDIAPAWLEEKKEIINQTLHDFGIDGEVINYTKGPAFTLYEIMLAPGVNVKKINQIYDNLQMNLLAKSIRILAPIPGRNTVGIEAPNNESEIVKFGDILNDEFIHDGHPLHIALGKNIDGSPVYQDIEDMPHALIAGATKSGKSVCMNTILLSLILKNSPEDLKLILVDPKKVELSFYSEIPHLATPVIVDPAEATEALKWATVEMDRRFDILSRHKCKQIKDYNKKWKNDPTLEKMPYLVCVVDEFNDLVMQCGQEVTDHIVRLAQKGRACGIHVILATQRPTVDVVSGTIKANIACRIAFKVASSLDSSIILDETGAENLLGRGDMLFKNNDTPFRAQGAYMEDDEIESVCDYISEKYSDGFMFTHDDLRKSLNKASGIGASGKDASDEDEGLLYEIASFCVENNTCSINSIQNNFSLGFNRAQRIVNLFEEMNIVSPKCGTKSREILVDQAKLREIFEVND